MSWSVVSTMVPISPVKPWKRITATTGALLLLAVLVMAPWLPERASLNLLRVSFEREIAQKEAYELASLFTRAAPESVMVSAELQDSTVSGMGGEPFALQ